MPKRKQINRDDDASEPYSDELNVSSPEVLEMGDEGEVIMNSDWTALDKRVKKKARKTNIVADIDAGIGGDELNPGSENIVSEEDAEAEAEEAEWESEQVSEDEDEAIKRKIATVSFGSLAKAQDSLGSQDKKRKRVVADDEAEEKLAALKQRLKELQQRRKPSKIQQVEVGKPSSQSDLDSEDAEEQGYRKNRSSKHAPTSMSSRKTVSRRREAISVPNAKVRDPRFDAVGGPVDREKHRQNYAFLDEYVDSEIKDLKSVLKTQKSSQGPNKKKKPKGSQMLSQDEIEGLKKELIQKESKKATQDARNKRMDVIREHKKQEKELVKTGKKPYFLKNSDVQKKVLVDRFDGMSQGKREKIMEKKRRRVTSKERRNMPFARREV